MLRALLLLTLVLHVHQRAAGADRHELRDELRTIASKYKEWGLIAKGRTAVVDVPRDIPVGEVDQPTWSAAQGEEPTDFEAHRLRRADEKYRYSGEKLSLHNGVLDREELSCDGVTARFRSSTHSINTPAENQPLAETPHDFLSKTLTREEHGPELMYVLTQDEIFDEISVSEESLDGVPCWKVDFADWSGGRYWLSKEHDLLPIRVELGDENFQRIFLIETFEEVAADAGPSRWFPKRCVLLGGYADLEVTTFDLEILDAPSDADVFLKADLSSPAMLSDEIANHPPPQPSPTGQTPMSTIVAMPNLTVPANLPPLMVPEFDVAAHWIKIAISLVVIPVLILSWTILRNRRVTAERKARAWSQLHNILFVAVATVSLVLLGVLWFEPQLWVWTVPALAVSLPCAWLIWRKTKKEPGEPRYRVRTIAGICGAVLTAGLLAGLCFVPSWWQHGVAIALAGLFGLLWIIGMQCFIRSRRFSIMSILSLATCVAMIMAGVQEATQRIRERQKMIRALDAHPDATYGFDLVEDLIEDADANWFVTPEGMLIHRRIANALGQAAIGEVTWIVIPPELLTAPNIRSWNLRDVSSIHVNADDDAAETPVIDATAIAAIPSNRALTVFFCNGVGLTEQAIESLARFDTLAFLSFDAQGKTLPKSLKNFRSLETLGLQNAKIDRSSSETLRQLPEFVSVYLNNVEVTVESSKPAAMRQEMHVSSSEVTPALLQWLRNRHAMWLHFKGCSFAKTLLESDNRLNAETVYFENSPLSDDVLLTMADSPEIQQLSLEGTRVTANGMDQFSKKCPEATVEKTP